MPNKKWLSPGNSHLCIARKVKNCYKVNIEMRSHYMRCKLLLKPDSTPNYRLNKRLSFSCMLSIMEYSNRQSTRWEMPNSTQNYNSNKHLSFNCMSSIMEYLSKLSMRLLSPGNTRYCIARKAKNCYKVNTVLILLSMLCKLLLRLNSSPNYNSNKHLSFSYMLSIMEYLSKLSMRLL
jgi:hypothetical protein